MKREWKEDEISAGFRCPECTSITDIPLCNVCKNWDGYGKCKKLGKSPEAYSGWEKRDCPEAVLDSTKFAYRKFLELYPEDAKKLLERQK